MSTKVIAGMAVGLLLVASVAGFSLAEIAEYGEVALNRVAEEVRKPIPLSVELDRVKVLLDKLDRQVNFQKFAVAKAKVALEDAEAELEHQQSGCDRLLVEMKRLRGLTTQQSSRMVQIGCHSVSTAEVRQALAYKLSAWQQSTAKQEALTGLVSQQRTAYEQLKNRFTEWQTQRELLAHRLETLKARYETQRLAADTDVSVFNDADLARATDLAERIEKELRTVEVQQELENTPMAPIFSDLESAEKNDIEAQVDQILNNTQT